MVEIEKPWAVSIITGKINAFLSARIKQLPLQFLLRPHSTSVWLCKHWAREIITWSLDTATKILEKH